MLKSVRKTENGGYKTVTDTASTYVLCPRLWNQVSVNFNGSEDNEDDGEQSKDVWVLVDYKLESCIRKTRKCLVTLIYTYLL